MDLTPLQRKAAFAVIVLALAGLGAFLLRPGASSDAQARPGGGRAGRAHHAAATPPVTASTPPVTSPAPAGASPSQSAVNIYQWLPFSQSGLAKAAAVVRAFSADYATYSYTESAATYVGRMRGLITSQLSATLARGYATPGVAQQRAQQKKSATGAGQIISLRAFGPSSLTFLVTLTQRVSSGGGTSRQSTTYAVTVTGTGGGWQVNDIELATAGNS